MFTATIFQASALVDSGGTTHISDIGSAFVEPSSLAWSENLAAAKDLESCTAEVQLANVFTLDGRRVILINTPGFDDTTQSDTDILKLIAALLSTSSVHTGVRHVSISGLNFLIDTRGDASFPGSSTCTGSRTNGSLEWPDGISGCSANFAVTRH